MFHAILGRETDSFDKIHSSHIKGEADIRLCQRMRSRVQLQRALHSPFLLPLANTPAALSIPLNALTTFCSPAGKAGIRAVVLVYSGKFTSPLQPPSTILTISFANFTGATTGAKKLEGVFIPSNIGVSNCPGATRMVLISCDQPVMESSATRDWWKDSSAALEAV